MNLDQIRMGFHATSEECAIKIMKEGFKKSAGGLLGEGVYIALNEKGALAKSNKIGSDLTALIIVYYYPGSTLEISGSESCNDWNYKIAKSRGYDSVLKSNMRTGPEICIYDETKVFAYRAFIAKPGHDYSIYNPKLT